MSVNTIPLSAAPEAVPAGHTLYQLWIRLASPVRVAVGRFGVFDFPAGDYCYTGSARRNLLARLRRHCACEKRLRWHIDYLLAAKGAAVLGVRTCAGDECALNAGQPGQVLMRGFGSSDCRAGCGSHLKYCGANRGDIPPWGVDAGGG